MNPQKNYCIAPHEAGERLDRYLVKHCPEMSRSQIKHLIDSGDVQLNGISTKASHLLKSGEKIAIQIPPLRSLEALPQELPLEVLHEDEDLLVINKAAEMVVHLGAGVKEGTLVNALLHHCRDLSGIGGVARPGIVHRLDKGTSGLLVVAKNDRSHQRLSAQFQLRQIEKVYLAFVWGTPRDLSGKMDAPLGRSERDRKKISTKSRHLRSAVTRYRVVKSWGAISLLELQPETGRTHQLRAHLSEMGHPIVGDVTYGKGGAKPSRLSPQALEHLRSCRFQLLHAWKLGFKHPATGRSMNFSAPMREEMRQLQKILEDSVHDSV